MRFGVYIIVILLIGSIFYFQIQSCSYDEPVVIFPHVIVNKKYVKVEIADDFNEQMLGLSGRTELQPNHGMLFVFSDKQIRSFWMKNMNFPIDIIWIDGTKVVKIDENLAPEGEKPARTYSSGLPVDYVLEVSSGYAEKHGIKIGHKVIYKIN